MARSRKVLLDHRQQGRSFLPPFVATLGRIEEVSWARTIIPELLWIALVQRHCGEHQGVRFITELARSARAVARHPHQIFGAASDYLELTDQQFREVQLATTPSGCLDAITDAVRPVAVLYPDFPLRRLFRNAPNAPAGADLDTLKAIVATLHARDGREPTMTQATFVSLAFDAGVLKVFRGLSLAKFPEIERYPNTELSQRIAASIRSTIHHFFGERSRGPQGTRWSTSFWNRGMEISPCEFRDAGRS